jgi:hypothetical protein
MTAAGLEPAIQPPPPLDAVGGGLLEGREGEEKKRGEEGEGMPEGRAPDPTEGESAEKLDGDSAPAAGVDEAPRLPFQSPRMSPADLLSLVRSPSSGMGPSPGGRRHARRASTGDIEARRSPSSVDQIAARFMRNQTRMDQG